jgi:hypothetical protein
VTGPERRGTDPGHGEWDALAVGWALSALDAEDEELFAAHLPDCPLCTATVRESLYTVADLAYALPDEVPPPALKARILAAVAAEPRRPGAARTAAGDGGTAGRPPEVDPPPPLRLDLGAGPRSRRRWPSRLAAAAAVVLVAALGGWNLQLRAEQDDLRQLAAQREAAIRQLTANAPARVAALTNPTKPTEPRRATVVVRGDSIEIITENLGASGDDVRYWLWTLRCTPTGVSDLRPVRGFDVPQSRFSIRTLGSDPGFADAPCFAISEEIGSATPTTPRTVVAVGQPQ